MFKVNNRNIRVTSVLIVGYTPKRSDLRIRLVRTFVRTYVRMYVITLLTCFLRIATLVFCDI